MPKSSSRNPSPHNSQIKFNSKDDVYHVNDKGSTPGLSPSKTDKKGSRGGSKTSKSSLKESSSKSKSREKSSERTPATSTPKSSQHRSLNDLDISEIQKQDSKQTLKAESGNYVPSPYTFRAPGPETTKEVKGIPVKCPPYHLQLDHTLAVIWGLFSNQKFKRPLGIVQMQWALSFLRGIYNRKGEHPKDVALCIQTIEDELIEQYADMVDEVQYIKKPSRSDSKTKAKDKKPKSSKSSSITESIGEGEGEEKKEEETDEDKTEGCDDDTCENKPCDPIEDEKNEMVTKQVPFSINYAEMITRSPTDIEQLFPTSKTSGASSMASGTKKSTSGLEQTVSRDDMVGFLKAWRREQVEKIQAELKRLKSIENFIGSAETENFSPYLDEKQLDSLVAQKVVNPKDKRK